MQTTGDEILDILDVQEQFDNHLNEVLLVL